MARFLNTTGPCNPADHYTLPPEQRVVGAKLDRYVPDELYWALHAPRQTGKTTFLMSWMKAINASQAAVACYVSVERCQEFPLAEDSMPAICTAPRVFHHLPGTGSGARGAADGASEHGLHDSAQLVGAGSPQTPGGAL